MATRIERDTAKAMLAKLQSKLDALYDEQEAQKPQEMKCGGKVKKMFGGGYAPMITNMLNQTGLGANFNVGSPQLSTSNYANMFTGDNVFNPIGSDNNLLGMTMNPTTDGAPTSFWDKMRGGASSFVNDNSNLLYGAGVLSPAIYNLAQGLQKPEQMRAQDFYNPKAGSALSRMNQKYDPSQQLRQAEQDYATGSYQARTAAGGDRSTFLGNQAALMDVSQRNKAGILDTTQQRNIGQQNLLAQAELGVGEQMAGTNLNVDIMNAQNRAARRRHLGQSFSDLSGFLQTNRLMGNQRTRDQQLMDILPDIYGNIAKFSPWMTNTKIG